MLASHLGLVFKCFIYISFFLFQVSAGPALRRFAREIYPEIEPETDANQSQVCIVGDVVYGVDEPVPAEQPCLKCKCQPPGVQCEATRCASRKPGCKVVHRPNQCCPDYQCECEKDGRKYSNGERLETAPGGECKVCYCRGGEIQCTDVSCYIRNDCEGKQVPGQCCPKYEHCPTRDSVEKINKSLVISTLSNSVSEESIPQRTNFNKTTMDINADNTNNSSGSRTQTNVNSIQQGNSLQNPKITIQEIIPDIKEIPVIPVSKIYKKEGTDIRLIIEETNPTFGSDNFEEKSNDLSVTDADAESSEITEVIQNPPTIYLDPERFLNRENDGLVEISNSSSTPISIITLIEASGLQRGEIDEVNENTTINEEILTTPEAKQPIEENNNDLTSASSSHILSLVKKKKKPAQTPKEITTILPIPTTAEPKTLISSSSTGPTSTQSSSTETPVSAINFKSIEDSTTLEQLKNIGDMSTSDRSTETPSLEVQTKILELEIDENPAYPTLPDMLTRFSDEGWMKVETSKESNNSKIFDSENHKESKILHEILEMRSNKTAPINTTHNVWLKSEKESDEEGFIPLINLRTNSAMELLNTTVENNKTLDGTSEDDDFEVNTTPGTSEIIETSNLSSSNISNSNVELLIVSDQPDEVKLANLTDFTSEQSRSVETLESSEEYSGENTTPNNMNTAALVSEENASIESDKKDSEVNDMLFVKEYTIDLSNDEEKKDSNDKRGLDNSSDDPKNADVEMINVSDLEKNNTAIEPEKVINNPKKIDKRENSQISEDDAVFAELNQELGLGSTEKPKTPEEEEIEAKKIFQELIHETSTTKPEKPLEAKTKESEALERVGQVLAKLALRGSQPLDTGVLSVLRDFFSTQYRAYDSKSP